MRSFLLQCLAWLWLPTAVLAVALAAGLVVLQVLAWLKVGSARQAMDWVRQPAPLQRALWILLAARIYAVGIELVFDPDLGSVTSGVSTGALYGLIAVGLILIYRTNRIINFAV